MDRKNILEGIIRIAADIFECPASTLGEGTRLFTDLPCESIDLLEIAARISQEFHIQVDDDAVFLRSLRPYLEENRGQGGAADLILKKYPWCRRHRLRARRSLAPRNPRRRGLLHGLGRRYPGKSLRFP